MLSIGICYDNIHMLTYLAELCQKVLHECKVETHQTGSDFLNSQRKFDIILMDIMMEGADGLETVRQLRAIPSSSVSRRHAITGLFESDFIRGKQPQKSCYSYGK